MKYAVINWYGIELVAGRKTGKFLYIPRSDGRQSSEDCSRWIRRHDSANTCAIVEMGEVSHA